MTATTLQAGPSQPTDGLDATVTSPQGLGAVGVAVLVLQRWRLLVIAPLLVGAAALGIAFLIKPVFSARTTILPPQSQQSTGAAALASLGALAGLPGVAATRTPADQYAALMQSETVRNRLIDAFDLLRAYEVKLKTDARGILGANVRINVSKKDGLITIEVDDHDPVRAAAIANAHVDNLKRLSSELALTEAQQRRVFFESELQQTRERLNKAQIELQQTGFSAGALRSEPRTAAESYARLRAEVTAAEVRVQTLRHSLTENASEVVNQVAALTALRQQLTRLEATSPRATGPDYLDKYREFKYQETLYDLFSKQYELARLDESKDGALIQVIDLASPPERKSRPKRATIAVAATLATEIVLLLALMLQLAWRRMKADPSNAEGVARLQRAWSKR